MGRIVHIFHFGSVRFDSNSFDQFIDGLYESMKSSLA